MNNKIPRSFCTFETKTENIKFWSSAIGKKISANKRYTNEHTKCASTTVQLNFFVSKWSQMNLTVLQKPSIIKSRPFSQHQKCQVTIACSKMIQSCDAWKSKRFHLHMTKSILFLILQVCSVFYLATNTNGTIRGFFYHLFSVIYASLFFAVCFVETFERLAKTSQFLNIFKAVIKDQL